MSKIICDICGTSFSDTEERCPICGCAKGFTLEGPSDESAAAPVETEEAPVEETAAAEEPKTGRFAAAPKHRQKAPAPVEEEDFDDDDEDDDEYDDDDDDDEDDDDDDEDEGGKSNAPLVVALVIVILALLAVSAFIFVRYFMPNVIGPETTAPTAVTTTAPEQTTEPKVPCENLALTSGGEIVLDMEGANWLINVMALPENTTDEIVYSSSDESVATVNEQGKVTAVGEGTAVITITCGTQKLECTVTVDYTPETTAPETTAPETTDPSEPEDETTAPTEPEETTKPTEPLKNITLKVIRYTDLTFNAPGQGFTFVLDGLKNTEVKWTSMDEKVVTVDENGFVTSIGRGNTTIICEYGDQKVEIKVACKW